MIVKKDANKELEENVDTAVTSDEAQTDDTVSESNEETASDSGDEKTSDNTDDGNDSVASDTDDASDNNNDEEEQSSGRNKTLIVELLIAAVAVVIIVFALISNNKNDNSVSDNNAVSGNGNIAGGEGLPQDAVAIDNSVLYENIPAIPDLSELNTMTETEAEALAADESMIKLSLPSGGSIYVNNYTDLDYFSEQVVPSDEEVEKSIFYNITYYYIETTEGSDHTTVENRDIIIADYVGKLDGVAFDGGSAAGVKIMIGAGGYIPGFEDGFIGMEAGETKDVPVTFPEDYGNADLAGKDVIFTFTVNEISGSYTVPELTDQIVQESFYDGSATTVDECYEYFKTMITQDNIRTFIIDQYYVTEVSEEAVHNYYNLMMDSYNQTSMAYQTSVADLLSYSGATIDDLKADAIINAAYTAIEYSIYNAIAHNEGITVTEDDITELAAEYGYPDRESFINDFGEDTINEFLLQSNVIDYLVSLL